jgi:hypothetical protein
MFYVASQLGARLSEIGQHYDVINESVRPRTPPATSFAAMT